MIKDKITFLEGYLGDSSGSTVLFRSFGPKFTGIPSDRWEKWLADDLLLALIRGQEVIAEDGQLLTLDTEVVYGYGNEVRRYQGRGKPFGEIVFSCWSDAIHKEQ